MSMVMNPLTGKMDQVSILFVIDLLSITIDMMLHFDGDADGHGDGNVTCKQTLKRRCTRVYIHWLLTRQDVAHLISEKVMRVIMVRDSK